MLGADYVCGGRRAAARSIEGKSLGGGVGTRLWFDHYDASTDITGIDLCTPMLARARKEMASGRYPSFGR